MLFKQAGPLLGVAGIRWRSASENLRYDQCEVTKNDCITNRGGCMFDILIKGGMLIDGTGSARQRADLGIVNGRIAAMGVLEESARELW